jgi:bile acid transporter
MISGFEKTLLTLLVFLLMMGMGATLSIEHFNQIFKRPRAVLIGFCSQFGWMPLIGFVLCRFFSFPPEFCIGLIIISCTPGGVTSNLFTYFSKADVALSIVMTVFSKIIGFIMMPILLWMYATPFTTAEIQIPYKNIIMTLAIMLIPVMVGILIRKKSVRAATIIEKIGGFSGIAVLLLLIVSSAVRNKDLFSQTSQAMYFAAALLGLCGFGLGYWSARMAGLTVSEARTVCFETGVQNSPLAFAIILASFPDDVSQQILWLPMLYALLVLISGTILTFFYRMKKLNRY